MAPATNPIDLTTLVAVKSWIGASQIAPKAFAVPASSPYSIQTTALEDYGVVYSQTGIAFVEVASGPTIGQYTFLNGLYTFAAADARAAVQISYLSSGADDQTIQDCITAFSAYALHLTGRGPSDGSIPVASPFVAPVAYNEWYDGSGSIRQYLRNWPIQSVASLAVGPITIPQSGGWTQPGFVIDAAKKSLTLRGGGGFSGGTLRVGFGMGWGGYTFWYGPQNVNVQYTAGFAGVPQDLEMTARKIVSLNYKRRQWIGQRSQSMANGAGTVTFGSWEMDDDCKRVIEFYRRNAIV